MDNKVVNKQISIKQIIKVADYLKKYKSKYDEIFEVEEKKNKDLPYSEKNYEYEILSLNLKYTISLKEGKNLTESDYDWFIDILNKPEKIKDICLNLYISFETKSEIDNTNKIPNKIYVDVDFSENNAKISIDTTNQESEAHIIYSDILNILEENEDRYNKTIKNRKRRIQSFCISIGLIFSYILYIVLKINESKIPDDFIQYLDNKYVLIIGQWIMAIVLGNIFTSWIIQTIYSPLLPDTKYAGYNSSTYKSIYKDDIDDYKSYSEIHFGKYADAEKRRNAIEKIYKITSKILLVQLVISLVLYLILK